MCRLVKGQLPHHSDAIVFVKVSEYSQKIQQSHTTDTFMVPC